MKLLDVFKTNPGILDLFLIAGVLIAFVLISTTLSLLCEFEPIDDTIYIDNSFFLNSELVYLGYIDDFGYVFYHSSPYLFMSNGSVAALRNQSMYPSPNGYWGRHYFPIQGITILVTVSGSVETSKIGIFDNFHPSTDGSPNLSFFKRQTLIYTEFIENEGYILVSPSSGAQYFFSMDGDVVPYLGGGLNE